MDAIIWLIVTIALLIVEGVTAQMVAIWFSIGSAGALVAALCGAPLWLQAVLFVAISAVALALTRPLVKKLLSGKQTKTNLDQAVGQTAVVTEEVNNLEETGRAHVMGLSWMARSANDEIIPKGQTATVIRIEGVKVILQKAAVPAEKTEAHTV